MANPSPSEYALIQTVPDPFNPSTTFLYELPARSHVVIEVYDTLGRVVATLVDDEEDAGKHTAVWNPPTGVGPAVYFSRMTASRVSDREKTFVQIRKIQLSR